MWAASSGRASTACWTPCRHFDALVTGFVPNAASDPFLCSSTQEEHAVHMRLGVALEVARIIFLDDQWGFLDTGTVPCTVVQVKADFVTPPGVAEYMKRMMTVEVVVINTMGHFLQLFVPQR